MNLFELYASLSLDNKDYKDKLGESESYTESVGKKIQSVLGKLVTLEAIEKAGSALVSLGKSALANYADYEQLAGGAQLLFGDAYDFVAQKAQNAYKTVQMSQNDYLTQVNGFSTGLKEALGGDAQASAELADKIITAEADIISATGASSDAIQNAFNGIMKSNYTMLDNLQLGITPTKEGMQEVIDKMNQWNKEQGRSTNYQMGNLADMQSALVDYVEYVGMAGYAQMEASETIQGSLAMTKSAWSNLLTAMSDPDQSISDAMKGLLTSVQALGKNVVPVITELAPAMVDGLSTLGNLILMEAPKMFGDLLPLIAGSVKDLVLNVIDMLPSILSTAMDVIPSLLAGVGDLIIEGLPALVSSLTQMIPIFTKKISEIAKKLAQKLPQTLPTFIKEMLTLVQDLASTLAHNAPIIIEAGIQLVLALAQGLIEALPTIIEMLPEIIITFANVINDNAPTILKAGFDLIVMLVKGIIDAIPTLIENIPKILEAIWAVWQAMNWIDLGKNAVNLIKDGLMGAKNLLGEAGKGLIESIETALKNLPEALANIGKGGIKGMINGFKNMVSSLVSSAGSLMTSMMTKFKSFSLLDVGKNLIKGMIKGIASMATALFDTVAGMMTTVVTSVKGIFDQHSPSKVFEQIGKYNVEGFMDGMQTLDADKATAGFNDVINSVDAIDSFSGSSESVMMADLISAVRTQNVNVTLEGDARRLFKAMQSQASVYYDTTGRPAFA